MMKMLRTEQPSWITNSVMWRFIWSEQHWLTAGLSSLRSKKINLLKRPPGAWRSLRCSLRRMAEAPAGGEGGGGCGGELANISTWSWFMLPTKQPAGHKQREEMTKNGHWRPTSWCNNRVKHNIASENSSNPNASLCRCLSLSAEDNPLTLTWRRRFSHIKSLHRGGGWWWIIDGFLIVFALSANLVFRRAVHYCAVDFGIQFSWYPVPYL